MKWSEVIHMNTRLHISRCTVRKCTFSRHGCTCTFMNPYESTLGSNAMVMWPCWSTCTHSRDSVSPHGTAALVSAVFPSRWSMNDGTSRQAKEQHPTNGSTHIWSQVSSLFKIAPVKRESQESTSEHTNSIPNIHLLFYPVRAYLSPCLVSALFSLLALLALFFFALSSTMKWSPLQL